MRAILSLLLIISAVQAAELRVNRGILPGGLIDDRRLLGELSRDSPMRQPIFRSLQPLIRKQRPKCL